MMKNYIIICLILCSALVNGQQPLRKNIPGTKCTMEIKEGFVAAKRFNGFENLKGGAAVIVSVLQSPIEKNKSAFSQEEMKRLGMTFVSNSEPDLGGLKTSLFEMTQMNKGVKFRKYILIFGDTAKTVMINCGAPDSNSRLCEEVKAMALSVKYEPLVEEDLEAGVDFIVDAKSQGFMPAKYSLGGLVYTRDGKTQTESDDNASFLVGPSIKKVKSLDRKEFAVKRLNSLPGLDSLMSYQIDSILIDGLKGYEITGKAFNKKKEEQVVYEVMLFVDDANYYVMAGQATARFDDNLIRFRNMAKSFKRK
ncbi:MAG: hypothetical protein IPJ86_04320 [Bacteroidetes bacterium]|nr:hypothetical protein [Bacteroidota bacterium]